MSKIAPLHKLEPPEQHHPCFDVPVAEGYSIRTQQGVDEMGAWVSAHVLKLNVNGDYKTHNSMACDLLKKPPSPIVANLVLHKLREHWGIQIREIVWSPSGGFYYARYALTKLGRLERECWKLKRRVRGLSELSPNKRLELAEQQIEELARENEDLRALLDQHAKDPTAPGGGPGAA
jgi:hypothetical protein